jgi:hypothetical protein
MTSCMRTIVLKNLAMTMKWTISTYYFGIQLGNTTNVNPLPCLL